MGCFFLPDAERRLQKRYIAHKIRILDILESNYNRTKGFDSNYLEINGQEVSRVNVIGVVVQKSDMGNHKALIIDDGTGRVSARTFEDNSLFNSIDIGDFALIIGRPREFSSEKYILIEIIKRVNSGWAKVRKLEMEKKVGKRKKVLNDNLREEMATEDSYKNKILRCIKDRDRGEGVSIDDISSTDLKELDKVIGVLLQEGDVFEIMPGKLKVLE